MVPGNERFDNWNYLPDTTGLIIAQIIGNVIANQAPYLLPQIENKTLLDIANIFNTRYGASIKTTDGDIHLHEFVFEICKAVYLMRDRKTDTEAAPTAENFSGEGV